MKFFLNRFPNLSLHILLRGREMSFPMCSIERIDSNSSIEAGRVNRSFARNSLN